MEDANLLTAEAYRMKLTFQDLYYQCNHKDAAQFLDEWITMVRPPESSP